MFEKLCFTLLLVLTTSVQANDMDVASAENAGAIFTP